MSSIDTLIDKLAIFSIAIYIVVTGLASAGKLIWRKQVQTVSVSVAIIQ